MLFHLRSTPLFRAGALVVSAIALWTRVDSVAMARSELQIWLGSQFIAQLLLRKTAFTHAVPSFLKSHYSLIFWLLWYIVVWALLGLAHQNFSRGFCWLVVSDPPHSALKPNIVSICTVPFRGCPEVCGRLVDLAFLKEREWVKLLRWELLLTGHQCLAHVEVIVWSFFTSHQIRWFGLKRFWLGLDRLIIFVMVSLASYNKIKRLLLRWKGLASFREQIVAVCVHLGGHYAITPQCFPARWRIPR